MSPIAASSTKCRRTTSCERFFSPPPPIQRRYPIAGLVSAMREEKVAGLACHLQVFLPAKVLVQIRVGPQTAPLIPDVFAVFYESSVVI